MLTPSALKRRKLNDASSKLLKPFVSPLHARKPTPASSEQCIGNSTISQPSHYLPSTVAHTVRSEQPESSRLKQATPQHGHSHTRSTPIRKPGFWTLRSNPESPAEAAAQKEVRWLEQQIRLVQADIDILNQARQISQPDRDAHLTTLVGKWRLASQSLADELFIDAKERVDGMGGITAWKNMESHGFQGREDSRGSSWDEGKNEIDYADCEFDSQGEELPGEEQKHRKKMKEKARQRMLETADQASCVTAETMGRREQTSEDDLDNIFTMGKMLDSLNIDPTLLGYDSETQGWVS